MPRTRAQSGRVPLPFLLIGLLAVVTALWVALAPEAPDEAPGPATPAVQAPDAAPDRSLADAGSARTPTPRTSSPLVQARLTVLLSVPGWAELPASTEVELAPQGTTPGEARTARTRVGGAYVEFDDLAFGSYLVRVAAPGYAHVEVPVSVSEQAPAPRQAIALMPARRIVGQVLDAGGRPVPHMEVSARPVEPQRGLIATRLTARADDEGRYVIESLPEGAYWVHAGPLRSPISETVRVEVVGEQAWADVRVPPLAALSVTLRSSYDQRPLTDGRAQLQRVSGDGRPGHAEYRPAGDDGLVAFRHVPTGEYAVTALAPGHKSATKRIQLEQDEDGALVFELLPLRKPN